MVEERCRTIEVNGLHVWKMLKRRMRQPQRSREQLVVQRPLLTQSLLHCLAHLQQRKAGELGVQVSRRLCEVVGTQRFTGVNDLLRDLIASRHHDNEDLRAIQRYE